MVGAIYIDKAQIYISGAIFEYNEGSYGGAIYIKDKSCNSNFINVTIKNNIATIGSGGGVYATGNFKMSGTNSLIANNEAKTYGGGVMAKTNSEIKDATFSGNKASTKAGGGIRTDGYLVVKNVTFNNNFAKTVGGGLDYSGGRLIEYDSMVFNNNAAESSGNDAYPDLDKNIDWKNQSYLNLREINPTLLKSYSRTSKVINGQSTKDSIQGMTVAKDYIVFARVYLNNDYTYIDIVDKNTGEVLKSINNYRFGHANTLTYNTKEDKLYIFYTLDSKNYITSFKINSKYELTDVSSIEISEAFVGITYNDEEDYFIGFKGGSIQKAYKLDKEFNLKEELISAPTTLTKQDVAYCNNRFYYSCHEAGTITSNQTKFNNKEKNSNIVFVYKFDGTLDETLYIPYTSIDGEIESVYVEKDGTIYFAYNKFNDDCFDIYKTQITYNISQITLNKTSHTFTNNTPLELNATVEPDNATNKDIEWTCSNTNVATVDNTGKVTPISNGTCSITATAKDGSKTKATCEVTVAIPIKVTRITLNKTSHTFTNNTPLELNATVEPDNATNKDIEWTCSDTNVAIVDNTGKVTPVKNGTCSITATAKDGSNLSASIKIIVNIPIKVTQITLNKTSYTFTDSTPLKLVATILPENATNKEVTWETTAPDKLSVDSTGKVTPIQNKGGGMIIARAKDGSGKAATCNVTIDIPNKYISLNKSECTLKGIGENINLTARIYPSSMSQEVKWTSSNTNIATVDSTGKVTAVGVGTCEIIATSKEDSSLKASCNITVEEVKVTSITLNKTSYTFTDGTPLQLVATILPENATNKEITWETTTPGTLFVDSTGKVTPIQNKGGGMIIARAKDGSGKVATCNITINIGGSTTYKKGDINKDGKVTVMDVRYGLKALTKGTITDEEKQIGDVNGDNKFSVMDARKILRYIVGKIPSLD